MKHIKLFESSLNKIEQREQRENQQYYTIIEEVIIEFVEKHKVIIEKGYNQFSISRSFYNDSADIKYKILETEKKLEFYNDIDYIIEKLDINDEIKYSVYDINNNIQVIFSWENK